MEYLYCDLFISCLRYGPNSHFFKSLSCITIIQLFLQTKVCYIQRYFTPSILLKLGTVFQLWNISCILFIKELLPFGRPSLFLIERFEKWFCKLDLRRLIALIYKILLWKTATYLPKHRNTKCSTDLSMYNNKFKKFPFENPGIICPTTYKVTFWIDLHEVLFPS